MATSKLSNPGSISTKSITSKSGVAKAAHKNGHSASVNLERESVFNAFRQFGYLEGDLDPLGFLPPRSTPELQLEGEYAREAADASGPLTKRLRALYKTLEAEEAQGRR